MGSVVGLDLCEGRKYRDGHGVLWNVWEFVAIVDVRAMAEAVWLRQSFKK